MAIVADIMTRKVHSIEPQQTLQNAALQMRRLDVGSLPVCVGTRVLGMITDRDITVRATAAGLTPQGACVSDVMTGRVHWCLERQDCADVLRRMGEVQVRRLPVVNTDEELVGIVAIADLATHQGIDVDPTMREISSPAPMGATARADRVFASAGGTRPHGQSTQS